MPARQCTSRPVYYTQGPGAHATEKREHELYTRPAPASLPSLPVGRANGEWSGQVAAGLEYAVELRKVAKKKCL